MQTESDRCEAGTLDNALLTRDLKHSTVTNGANDMLRTRFDRRASAGCRAQAVIREVRNKQHNHYKQEPENPAKR